METIRKQSTESNKKNKSDNELLNKKRENTQAETPVKKEKVINEHSNNKISNKKSNKKFSNKKEEDDTEDLSKHLGKNANKEVEPKVETNFFNDEITLRENKNDGESDDEVLYEKKIDALNSNAQWRNRQRVLVVASRGVSHQERIVMNNIISLMPHSKKECKIDRKAAFSELNEICYNHSCTNCVYFEHRKREFLMWVFRSPDGPTLKFQINHVHTYEEPKLSGNCLKYSRPLLNFDKSFDNTDSPHLNLIKEMFTHIFNTPKNHPKSKPFYDHVISFSNYHGTIFFRNYQIVNDVKEKFTNNDEANKMQLIEIGPRFSLKLIKIFHGTLGGKTLFTNPLYTSPMEVLRKNANEYKERQLKLQKKVEEFEEKTKNPVDIQTRWTMGNKK